MNVASQFKLSLPPTIALDLLDPRMWHCGARGAVHECAEKLRAPDLFQSRMQTETIDDPQLDAALSESAPETNPYVQALAEIENRLEQLSAAFQQLDDLRAEEPELQKAADEAELDEKNLLANPNGAEKQVTERLLRIRATRDIRAAKLAYMRKRISEHVDLLIYDVGQPLRWTMSNLAHGLLNTRTKRFQALFTELIGVPYDHGLMTNAEELTRVSKPVQEVQRLANWIHREPRPSVEEELSELRSDVPRQWLDELRAIVQVETDESK